VTTPVPWLSILLPVHGVESYLVACAESILEQAGEGVELLFLDDASPDASATLLAALHNAHPDRVRVLHHTVNLGISAARNALLDAARGDYVWFIDPDDLMEPGALAALKDIIDAHGPDWVLCDFRSFDDATGLARRTRHAHQSTFVGQECMLGNDPDLLVRGLLQLGQLHPWSKVIRRSTWPRSLRFPVGRVFEDLAVFPRLALHATSYFYSPTIWVAYRQRPGSTLANLTVTKLDDWTQALVDYGGLLRNNTPETRFVTAHFCARTFLRATTRLTQLNPPDITDSVVRLSRRWQASSPLSEPELLRGYLRRGWLWRALQFAFWMWHVQHEAKSSSGSVTTDR
jgi:glycosyltransferase involved in cell wall biosynthesis